MAVPFLPISAAQKPEIPKTRAPLLAVNSAAALMNPPALGRMECEIIRVPRSRPVLIPFGPDVCGHGSPTVANLGKDELTKLLADTETRRRTSASGASVVYIQAS